MSELKCKTLGPVANYPNSPNRFYFSASLLPKELLAFILQLCLFDEFISALSLHLLICFQFICGMSKFKSSTSTVIAIMKQGIT